MRRDKKSLIISRADIVHKDGHYIIPHFSDITEQKLYSKLLLADYNEVSSNIFSAKKRF